MFELSITKDSAKGANSVLINGIRSNDPAELFSFLEKEQTDLFIGTDDNIDEYYLEAFKNLLQDKKIKLYNDQKAEAKRIVNYLNVGYDLEGSFEDRAANAIFESADNHVKEFCSNDIDICKYIMTELSLFNIGINFKKVSE